MHIRRGIPLGGLLAAWAGGVSSAQTSGFSDSHRMVPWDFSRLTRAIAVGDLDGDGDLDALASRGGIVPVLANRLLLNDGLGRLSDATDRLPPYLAGSGPLALGDVDGDGDVDALTGHGYPGPAQLRLLLNDGSASFVDATAQLPVNADVASALSFGDLDGDGDLDAFVGNSSTPARVLVNAGGGVFAVAATPIPGDSAGVGALALVDVDGDGDLDAFLGRAANLNRLFLNDGAAAFVDASGQLPVVDAPTWAAAFGDLDGDGDADALLGVSVCGSFTCVAPSSRLLENDGTGIFADAPFPAVTEITSEVALADADGDGDLDAFVGRFGACFEGFCSSGSNLLFLNDGSGGFAGPGGQIGMPPGWSLALAPGDMDGDGDVDLLSIDDFWRGGTRLLLNRGNAILDDVSGPAPEPLSANPSVRLSALALADFDDDGDLDCVAGTDGGSVLGGTARLFRNDGNGTFLEAPSPVSPNAARAKRFAVGDVDGDGDLDAFLAADGGPAADACRLFLNDGTGAFVDASSPFLAGLFSGTDADLGDVDGDGDLDAFVVRGTYCGAECPAFAPRLFLNDGDGLFANAIGHLPPDPITSRAVALGDLDGDGDLDAYLGVSGFPAGGQDRLYLNDGTGHFVDATSQLPSVLDSTRDVALGDVDGDGALDVLVGNDEFAGPQIDRLFLNDGQGEFTDASGQLPAGAIGTLALALFDGDGDGDLDAFFGGVEAARYLVNDGAGAFADATPAIPAGSYGTADLAVGDVDGDGDLDVVVGSYGRLRVESNRTRHLSWRSLPRVGKPLPLDLHGPAWGAWFLAAALAPANLALPPFGTLRLDLSVVIPQNAGILDAQGRATVTYAVPADPALVGGTLYWQALVTGFGGPPGFTNLETTTLSNL